MVAKCHRANGVFKGQLTSDLPHCSCVTKCTCLNGSIKALQLILADLIEINYIDYKNINSNSCALMCQYPTNIV